MKEVLNSNADKITKTLVVSGCLYSNYQSVYDILVKAGLAEAPLSKNSDMLLPVELQQNIFKFYDVDTTFLTVNKAVHPAQEWLDQANQLLRVNQSNQSWGWADPHSLLLLDFWKDLNPTIHFVLTYDAPEVCLAKAFLDGHSLDSESDINAVLKTWIHSNTEILRFYYRNSECCVLVNSAICRHESSLLLQKIHDVFDVDLLLIDDNKIDNDSLIVTATLLKSWCDHNSEVNKLYNELEVSADITSPSLDVLNLEKLSVVEHYNKTLTDALNMQIDFDENTLQIEILQEELSDERLIHQSKLKYFDNVKAENTQLILAEQLKVQEFNELQSLNSALEVQSLELTLTLEALTKQMELDKSILMDVEAENTQLILAEQLKVQEFNELQSLNSALEVQSLELTLTLEALTKQMELDKSILMDVEAENELLLLQLSQLQEELEFYLVDSKICTETMNELDQSLRSFTQFWQRNQASEVIVDFRHEIVGEHWHQVEEDGRWAGGISPVSTLKIPALREGRYEFYLDVVDSMAFDILTDLQIVLNGRSLSFSLDSTDFPIYVYGEFVANNIDISPLWLFEFKFSRLTNPVDEGLEDDRNLAIRIRSLVLRRLD